MPAFPSVTLTSLTDSPGSDEVGMSPQSQVRSFIPGVTEM